MKRIGVFMLLLNLLTTQAVEAQNQLFKFPDDWMGTWEGNLEIHSGSEKVNVIPMTLQIAQTNQEGRYTYFINYGNNEAGLRPYYLIEVDRNNGHFAIDEANGIVIDAYLMGGRLISNFDVMRSSIQSSCYVLDDIMHYEIYAGRNISARVSGDTIIGTDTIPVVESFPVTNIQIAQLHRVKE